MRDFGYMEKGKDNSIGDLQLWVRILRNSSGYKPAIGIAVILSLGVTFGTLGLPYLMKSAIDLAITATTLPVETRFLQLSQIAIWFLLLIGVVFLLTFVQVVLLEWVGQSVMHRIRQDLFRHIVRLDLSFLNKQPTGRLVTRLTNDVQNMHEMFTSVLVTLFNDILRIIGILIVLFMINVRLALIMAVFVPLALVLTVVFSQLAREKFRGIRSQLSRLNSFIQETVSGIAIIQLFNQQNRTFHLFQELSKEYLNRTLMQIRLFGAFMPLTELLSSTAIALILWYGGSEIISKRLSIGELVAFLAYMRLFFQPLRELSQKYSIVQSALASAERIFAMLDTKRFINDPSNPVDMGRPRGRLTFDGLRFSYDESDTILDDISITISPGETVAIVGKTGSGKTTLINLLLRFYDPQHGTIRIDKTDIRQINLQDLRHIVGVILQDVFILKDSLFGNIVMDTGRTRKEVLEILYKTGIDRFVERLPNGLDTILGEGGQQLSTGEKQLLSFARALCRNPAVLVLDEATAFIDSETESILEEAVEESFSDTTSIIIAHRLSTIRRADRILVMDAGKIIEQGSHSELLARQGYYSQLVERDLIDQPRVTG